LGIIFAGKLATGEFASSSQQTPQAETGFSSDATDSTLDPLNNSDITLQMGATPTSRDATAGKPPRKQARSNPTKDAGSALAEVIVLLKKRGQYVEIALSIFDKLKVKLGLTTLQSMRFKKALADNTEYSEFFSKMSSDEQRIFIGEVTGAVVELEADNDA
jgi:hypothetical protein